VCRNGGKPVIRAKLLFIALTAGGLSVLFSLTPLCVYAVSSGLSSPGHPLQMLEQFRYCPFALTVGEYLLIFVLLRILFFTAVSLAVAAAGQIYENEKFSILLAVLLAASGVFLSGISPDSPLYFLQKFSVYEIADIHILFTRYRGINFFGNCFSYTYVIIISILIVIAGVVILSFHVKSHELKEYKSENAARTLSDGSLSLFRTELYKQFICHKALYLLLGIVLVKCVVSGFHYEPRMNSTERLYMEYMAQVQGEITPEKLRIIEEEETYIRETIAGYPAVLQAYRNGELSSEEFQLAQGRYNYAVFSERACERLCERRDYLLSLPDSLENVQFIYEDGMDRYFGVSFDITAVLSLLLLGSIVFSCEYESGFVKILRASAGGREHTFRSKMLYAAGTAVGLYIIFGLIHGVLLTYYFDIDYLGAHLVSMPRFGDSGLDMSIGEYLVLYQLLSFLGYLTGILFICSLSVFMENQMKTMITAGAVMMTPALLRYGGIPLALPDFAYYLTPGELHTGGVTYLFCTAAVLIGIAAADRKWNHRRQSIRKSGRPGMA